MNLIEEYGISKTVYSLYFPETASIVKKLWENQEPLHSMYEAAYTKKQDPYHLSFGETFKKWSSPSLMVKWEDFSYFYPTNGASEAIREQLAYLSNTSIKTLFVLEGEYEGYEAIAIPLGFNVIKLDKSKVLSNIYDDELKKGGYFFISQPSSIDGNVWEDFDNFVIKMNSFEKVDIYIDTVYVGCIDKDYSINLNYNCVKGIFFSLSKSFGVYYHRIGGVFLKESNPLLYGNMWFKNIFSLKLGEELMNNFDVNYFPQKYKNVKEQAIKEVELSLGIQVEPADALLLSNAKKSGKDYEGFIVRSQINENIRICLTPIIEKMIRE